MYPLFELFGFEFHTYAVCAIVGIVFALILLLFRSRSKRFTVSTSDVFFVFLVIVSATLIGSKFSQILGNIVTEGGQPEFWTLENFKSMIPGIGVFYGGLIGGFLGGLLGCRLFKVNVPVFADICAPSIPLFHAIGRIGCFMAGCCYGKECTWGVTFPSGVTRIPVQLIESGCNVLIMIMLLCIKPKKEKQGILLPIYAASYAVCRFVIEFFRGDTHRGVFILSTSQWISIPVLIVSVIFIVYLNKRAKRISNEQDGGGTEAAEPGEAEEIEAETDENEPGEAEQLGSAQAEADPGDEGPGEAEEIEAGADENELSEAEQIEAEQNEAGFSEAEQAVLEESDADRDEYETAGNVSVGDEPDEDEPVSEPDEEEPEEIEKIPGEE